MKFFILAYKTAADVITDKGYIYGWYESLATALNTCTNLRQQGVVWQAVACKVL